MEHLIKKAFFFIFVFLIISPSAALAAADLTFDIASANPYPANYGQEITIRFSVKNIGNQVSNPCVVELKPATLENDYVYYLNLPATVNIPALNPLQSSEVFTYQRTINFQKDGIGGIKLTLKQTPPDANPGNDTRTINVFISPQGAPGPPAKVDLMGGGISVQPASPTASQPLSLYIIVKNAGPGAMTQPAKAAIYMFKDNQSSTVDMKAWFGGQYATNEMVVPIPLLQAGQPHQIVLNSSHGLGAGNYRMTVAINKYYDTILETNYNNNDMQFTFGVSPVVPNQLKKDIPLLQQKSIPGPKPPDPGPPLKLKTSPAGQPPAVSK